VHLGAAVPRTPDTHAGGPPAIVALGFYAGNLTAARDDGTVGLYDRGWNEVDTRRPGGVLRALAVMPRPSALEAPRLATAGDDGIVRLGKERLSGHKGSVGALAAGPSPASGGDDGTIRIWDHAKTVFTDGARVRALAWAGEDVISGDLAGVVRRWKLDGTHTDWQAGAPVEAVAAHGDTVAAVGRDGALTLWPAGARAAAHRGPARALAVSPTGLLATAGDDGTVRLFDPAGHPLATLVANRATWVVIGDDGAVDGSPDLLEWHAGQVTLPGSAAFSSRRTPGLLARLAKVTP
jgi:WD40 repeat protein